APQVRSAPLRAHLNVVGVLLVEAVTGVRTFELRRVTQGSSEADGIVHHRIVTLRCGANGGQVQIQYVKAEVQAQDRGVDALPSVPGVPAGQCGHVLRPQLVASSGHRPDPEEVVIAAPDVTELDVRGTNL